MRFCSQQKGKSLFSSGAPCILSKKNKDWRVRVSFGANSVSSAKKIGEFAFTHKQQAERSKELTELTPQNSVSPEKLTEFGV